MGQVIFITGTDTGAGKTLLAALLLRHLRQSGRHALAMKPFCTGDLSDVRMLSRAQDHEIPIDRVNPFFFKDPVAPLVAARRAGQTIGLAQVLFKIRALADECEILLVEGAGGLFVPLGKGYTVADVIAALQCPALVAVRNRLGAINHTLLTVAALHHLGVPWLKVVLMDGSARGDLASRTNGPLIREMAPPIQVFNIPFLGRTPGTIAELTTNAKKLKKTLAAVLKTAIFTSASRAGQRRMREKESEEFACTGERKR